MLLIISDRYYYPVYIFDMHRVRDNKIRLEELGCFFDKRVYDREQIKSI